MIDLYYKQKLSQSQIAKKLNLSRSRIGQIMKDLKMQNRSYASASSNLNNQRTVQFTETQQQLIYGSMLGDAGLYRNIMHSNKTGNPMETIRLILGHSIKQLQYLLHKKDVIGGCEIGERTSGFGAIIKHFSFCHTPTLRPYAEICLDENYKKSINKKWLDKIEWLGIAYWYMDDGSLIISKNRPVINFHTESFSHTERSLLQEMLFKRFSLHTRLATCNNDQNQKKLVSRHKHEVTQFLKELEPYIIPSMRYKIRWLDIMR